MVRTTEVMLGRPCYRVSFSDGTSIVADAEHEWLVGPRWGRPTVLTTAAMADRVHVGLRADYREHRYRVPVAGPLDCEGALLPVAPYTLGAWLGDGSSRGAAIMTADPPILASIRAEGYRVGAARDERGAAALHSIGLRTAARPALQTTLRYQGLLGHKRIPDGHVSPRGQCEFTTTSEDLFGGTRELIRSLGMKPTWTAGRATLEGRDCGPKWRLRFHPPADLPVFRLARKLDRLAAHPGRRRRSESRHITAIEPVPSVPVRCIEVDAPSHLYLAGEAMVPTHNSLIASAFGHYFLVADGEAEPEVYVAAAARGQAGIVLGQARRIGLQSPLLRRRLRIQTHLIECPRNGGLMRALSANAAPDRLERGLDVVVPDALHVLGTGQGVDLGEERLGLRDLRGGLG